MRVPFDLVLGRRTYDIFAGYWPTAPIEAGGKPLNDATKYVASRGTPSLTGIGRCRSTATSPTVSPR